MLPQVVSVDTRNWMAGFVILHRRSRTDPGEALAKAVAFVVVDAKANTPFVEVGEIDTELAVEVTPRMGKRGQPLSTRSAKTRLYRVNGLGQRGSPDLFPAVPLSWLIIGARANPASKFNASNSGRWLIAGGNPMKGHKVSEFAGIMADYLSRMVKGRHSHTHFFQQSWNGPLADLAGLVPARFRGYFMRSAGQVSDGIGSATLVGAGSTQATLTIENRLGMDGEFPKLDEQRNEAARRILVPVLQAAIDRNFEREMQLAAERGLLEAKEELRALGFE